ncbi:MAG: hypothetical protein ACLGHA_08495 [Gammaproteobacteria bacterium]
MNIRLIKHTLVAVALGSLGLASTLAQAGHEGFSEARDVRTSHPRDYGDAHHARSDFRQSRHFIQRVHERQDRQRARIVAAQRSGELTRPEFRALMREQHQLAAMKQRLLADGVMDAREFRRMDRALDRANAGIRSETHDHHARNARGGHDAWFN